MLVSQLNIGGVCRARLKSRGPKQIKYSETWPLLCLMWAAQLSDPRSVVSDAYKTLTAMVLINDDHCLLRRYQLNLHALKLISKTTYNWLLLRTTSFETSSLTSLFLALSIKKSRYRSTLSQMHC